MPAAATQADALRFEVSGTEISHLEAAGAIPGVAVLAAGARNGPGVGTLRSEGEGTLLTWQAPGSSTAGGQVAAASNGTYLLLDGDDPDKWLRVQVWASYLLSEPTAASIPLADVYDNGLAADDVTAGEATAGSIETYQVTVANDSSNAVTDILAWLDAATSDLEISDDGIAWVSPTTEGTALDLGDLAAGGSTTLHLRRTIGAGASADAEVLNLIHASFLTW